jgi:hypothetical protein
MQVVLNRRLARSHLKRLEFREAEPEPDLETEPGLESFLADPTLSSGTSEREIAYLKGLRPEGKRPTALFYYRELQNLRDPLNFLPSSDRRLGTNSEKSVTKHAVQRTTVKSRRRRAT